ncbi:hypothetical protein MRX96_018183 [Rhipicephalus microplus]
MVTIVTAPPSSPIARPTWSCLALLLPSGPAACRDRRHGSCPPEFREGPSCQAAPRCSPYWLPGTAPSSVISARDSGFSRGGPFIAGIDCVALVGTGWFRSTGVLTPFCPGATTPAGPGRRRSSVRRHVEFEHGVRVRERIYVCTVCDAPLTSRPSYHHCLARATLVPSTETPRRRCGVCDATFTTKRGLANHLRCHVDKAGPSGAARERAPARRVPHVSTSSDTSSSGSGSSSPPAAPRASRRLRGLLPSDAASPVWPPSSPAARSGASSPASIGEPSAFVYQSSSGSSTSVGLASVPGSPAPSPAASPAPSEKPLRDAESTSSPTPHIGVPTPAGVPANSPVLGSPQSPEPASPRPPSSARQVLVPYDFGASSSSNGASPAPRGSSAASPVGDAAFLLDDDDTISYDAAVSSPPLDAGSSPVILPGSPLSPASSPSPPASVDEAAVDPDEVQEHPETDSTTLQMPPDHTRLLEDQARLLRSLLRDPPTDESWAQCEEAWTRAVALAVEAVRLPPVRPGRQRRQPDPSSAVDLQRLYRRNLRRVVRLILEGPPQTCAIPLQDLQDHWGHTWSACQADSTLLFGRDPAPAGVDMSDFSTDEQFLSCHAMSFILTRRAALFACVVPRQRR